MTAPERRGAAKKRKYRILLVDDHPLIRQGLIQLIGDQADMEVCGEAEGCQEALEKTAATEPDLAVIDLSLGERSGMDLIKAFRSSHPNTLIMVLSMHDELFHAERALRAGARGYVMKGRSLDEVLDAIRMVLRGEVYLSQALSSQVLQRMVGKNTENAATPLASLSDRELQVLELIGEGMGTSQIAQQLHLSVKTIETYRAHIKRKLNLQDAAALRRYAVQLGKRKEGESGNAPPPGEGE